MISAVILCRNSAQTLARTLESLTFCNERIVIDDYSSDKTEDIARQFSAKVFKRNLNDDFASQRNFGLEKAAGEWVFFVDSDEVISMELAKEIKEKTAKPDIDGFYMRRQDVLWGKELKHGETGRVRLLRLGRKGKGAWQRPVHEVWNIAGPVETLIHPLFHFPHPNVAQFIEEINQYSTLNARYLYGKKIRASWWHIPAYPTAKFFVNYILKLGFLDGTAGAVVALAMSFHSFLTRAKLWQLWHPRKSA